MKRRTFLKALALLSGAPLIKVRQQPSIAPGYTDSDGNLPAVLLVLSDKDRASGGITYQG